MIRQHRLHANLCAECGAAAGLSVAGKGDAARVGRPARRQRYSVELSQLVLVFAVIIHRPNFFVAASIAHERDLSAGDSRQTTRKFADDLIGKLVSEDPNLCIGGISAINLANDGRQRCIANVIQPGLNLHAIAGDGEIAALRIGARRGIVTIHRKREHVLEFHAADYRL